MRKIIFFVMTVLIASMGLHATDAIHFSSDDMPDVYRIKNAANWIFLDSGEKVFFDSVENVITTGAANDLDAKTKSELLDHLATGVMKLGRGYLIGDVVRREYKITGANGNTVLHELPGGASLLYTLPGDSDIIERVYMFVSGFNTKGEILVVYGKTTYEKKKPVQRDLIKD